MSDLGEAAELGRRGERAAARERFRALWERVGPDGDALHRCAIAHSMADVQDDIHDELRWDLEALAVAEQITDEQATAAGAGLTVAGFYPSLHLNLASCYRRLGDPDRAREHLLLGREAAGALPEDAYGDMVRSEIGRLERALLPAQQR
ncbi:MAG: hypothetical protein ACRDG3_02850 [Tepidiformaceae bacterium]